MSFRRGDNFVRYTGDYITKIGDLDVRYTGDYITKIGDMSVEYNGVRLYKIGDMRVEYIGHMIHKIGEFEVDYYSTYIENLHVPAQRAGLYNIRNIYHPLYGGRSDSGGGYDHGQTERSNSGPTGSAQKTYSRRKGPPVLLGAVSVIAIVVLAIVVLSVWGSSQSTATAPVNTAPEAPAVTVAATTGLSVPAGKELTTLQVAGNDELGPILTDGEGMSLYILDADQGGESTCYDACAEAWPPAVLVSDPEVGEEVNTTLIRVIERTDGKTQLTYNGYPLYYYWEDEAPGDVKGHQIASPLGLWTAISPDGETARK